MNKEEAAQQNKEEIDNALLYAYQVKAKLRDNPKLYENFLIMMKYYESGEIDQLEVFRRIGHIFQEHPELIVGFNQVLTPGFTIQVQTNDQGCAVRVSLCMSISPPTIMPKEDVEMSVDSTSSPNEAVVSQSSDFGSRMERRSFDNALSYLDEVKYQFEDQPWVYDEFLSLMRKFNMQELDTRGIMRRLRKLFHGHRELIVGLNQFLPPGYKLETNDDD
ncbi:hypothetical protein TKK_0003261 [Trichogramma kaykai]|uniref:Uncharacterized protein n=1 Tax=Trichogramma kaykai TaxID=54128 RepID=A0ABD2WT31_9HYME